MMKRFTDIRTKRFAILLIFAFFTSGTMYATENTCTHANAVEVTVSVVFAIPTIILGSTPTICQGTTSANLTYSATTESPDQYSINFDAVAEAEGFVDVINMVLPVSPITLTIPGGTIPGTYNGYLSVKNSGTGQISQSYLFQVNIITSPEVPGTIFGQQTVQQSTVLVYSVFSVPDAATYNWSVPTGWIINSGNGTTEINITTGSAGNNGNVSVTAQNSCGTSLSSQLAVTVVANHPHIDCMGCHILHSAFGSSLTASAANANLCMSCHNSTGSASSTAIANGDKAIPGTSGNSHAWDVDAVNLVYETVMPINSDMATITDGGKILCSTCHDQHNPNTFTKYLRVSNAGDNICKDCHSPRNVGIYATDNVNNRGSHPVGITYDGSDDRFNVSPTSTSLISGNIECSSCHQMHFANTNDGNLLRMTNDENLCKDCHTYNDHQGFTCKDCHDTHNPNKSNILMVGNSVNGSIVNFTTQSGASFGDESGAEDGICEVCHTSTTYHLADGTGTSHNPGSNCITCHPHDANFAAAGCLDCHIVAFPGWGITDSHLTHTETYANPCSTCHLDYGSGGSLEGTHPSSTLNGDNTINTLFPAQVNFDPNGLATRNGNDGNTPAFNDIANTCSSIYCHSDGLSAQATTGPAGGTDTWDLNDGSIYTIPALPNYATVPEWSVGTVTCGDCHIGNTTGTVWPGTGDHTRNAHKRQCYWCHSTDNTYTYMGTYGTSNHVTGDVFFNPTSYSYVPFQGTIIDESGDSWEEGHCALGRSCWYN